RDGLALPLIEACVAQCVPIFGICRGFQEMNFAAGGSLHPEIRELPVRMNHRMPRLETGEIHPVLYKSNVVSIAENDGRVGMDLT
ncbi:gamma-glutamyl-gamma-aminobutyrate hydrolase family protein, partial [Rhizobium johnstonii]|uniref:gamma-glutamyl-gamma-aminobutyrate hydrolase family protein n=1 Tax=Rhizobium johnstonii TaxID=3019933 RepID=UPI003F9B9FBB